MPELPEVEILARQLSPVLRGRIVRRVTTCRDRVLAPTTAKELRRALRGAQFVRVRRRGKYLLFEMRPASGDVTFTVLGHLGMTGRFFLASNRQPLPKHAPVMLDLDRGRLIFEDTRYFGRFTLDTGALARLGPEPLHREFTAARFAKSLRRSRQAVKVKLLDQIVIAGVGNIYASEALFRARISPRRAARRLTLIEVRRLWRSIREVLRQAIRRGSNPLPGDSADGVRDGLFYSGRGPDAPNLHPERWSVYDREGRPCRRCGTIIRRINQAARSTYFCPSCQGMR